MKKNIFILLIMFLTVFSLQAQHKKAGPHDFGKMWTFEHPPKGWFQKAYNFNPDDQWFNDVRMSALKMSTGCSASFVSPKGLIMTNHHCSRDAVLEAQRDGENILEDGFFANTIEDERKVENVYFEQLKMLADITGEMNKLMNESTSDDLEIKEGEAIDSIKRYYKKLNSWEGLRLQVVKYYSGVKFSLYGYKKYKNIKLVAIPESSIAFYGGDPDNFTYPRYDVDFTFWRAYDDDGNPVNSSANYFKFNIDGVHENEEVFVVGNPARTERYRTVDQLKWDRSYRYPMTLDWLRKVGEHLQEEYEKNPSDEKLNMIFGLSNSEKAYSGIYKGLNNPELFGRKVEIEQMVRKDYKGEDYWNELKTIYDKMATKSWAVMLLSPSPLRGNSLMLMHSLYKFDELKKNGGSQSDLDDMIEQIEFMTKNIGNDEDKFYTKMTMELVNKYAPADNSKIKNIFNGKNPQEYVQLLMKKSKFYTGNKWKKILNSDVKKYSENNDMLLQASRILIPEYVEGTKLFSETAAKRKKLEGKIAQQYFKYFGSDLPPDATFTLRISDGIVKGYKYNGTQAPYKTTFFGMYNRNYSFDHEYPWALPERWNYPPYELLQQPLDFVSTNDIIGGNSGSAIINKNKEVVGLIFDGNIESLPGNFIFDEEYNRAVSVHAGGIYAALKYMYHAKRLMNELVPDE